VAGSAFLNGLAADEAGNLYAADTDLGKVYKIAISTKVVTDLATSGLTGANGVFYDKPNNRLIAVFWRSNAPVSEISLETGVVTPLLNTPYSNLDGITQDNCGNFYFSSWGSNKVYVVNSDFSEDPVVFISGLNGPADIFFDQNTQELWVPNFSSNSIKSTIAFLPCLTPEPLLPEDGSDNQTSRNLEFSWTAINHAKSYRLELSLTPIFADIVLALASGESTINVESLDVNTTYYWRVAGSDGGSYTDYSPVFTFKTEESSSINNLPNNQMVKVFPNPAQSKIGLAWEESGLKVARIEIINITGQEKWSKDIQFGSKTYEYIDIQDWSRGVYFINSFLENSEVLHLKLIVH
jgi:DNA-binding beta-propeller fold protein YncE